jgi:hypothetical protein
MRRMGSHYPCFFGTLKEPTLEVEMAPAPEQTWAASKQGSKHLCVLFELVCIFCERAPVWNVSGGGEIRRSAESSLNITERRRKGDGGTRSKCFRIRTLTRFASLFSSDGVCEEQSIHSFISTGFILSLVVR